MTLEQRRLVEVWARKQQSWTLGSGYLIGPGVVLAARHIIYGAQQVLARRLSDDDPYEARILWASRRSDTSDTDAVLLFVHERDWAASSVPPVRWGQLTGSSPVPFSALGLPVVERQSYGGVRDTRQIVGHIEPGTRAMGRRYTLNVHGAIPQAVPEYPSPWVGMSGAAVLCGELLTAIVTLDEPDKYRHARLTATPVAALLNDSEFCEHLIMRTGNRPVLESVELAPILERPLRPTEIRSVATLLRAEAEVVRFRGREDLLESLHSWCDGAGLSARLLSAPGGQGKTRLARELCGQLQGRGWTAGQLAQTAAKEENFAAIREIGTPLLLIVDYAETRPEQICGAIEAALVHSGTTPIRFLLLARSSGEWWLRLRHATAHIESLLARAPVDFLPRLENTDAGRREAWRQATVDFAERVGDVPGYGGVDWIELAHQVARTPIPDFATVLDLQMSALATLLETGAVTPRGVTDASAEEILLGHEQRYWERSAASFGVTYERIVLQRAVAVATLCGAVNETEAQATLRCVSGLSDYRAAQHLTAARWLRDLYPPSTGQYWGSLQPDRLAEHLVSVTFREGGDAPEVLRQLLPAVAFHNGAQREADQLKRALTLLSRLPADVPGLDATLNDVVTADPEALGPAAIAVASRSPTPKLLSRALEKLACRDDLGAGVLAALHDAIPTDSTAVASFGALITHRLVEIYRARADQGNADDMALLGQTLTAHAFYLMQLRALHGAVRVQEEVVSLARSGVRVFKREGSSQRQIAWALTNVATGLWACGRDEDALRTSEEAVTILGEEAKHDPDAISDLAAALLATSNAQWRLEERADALANAQEAVVILRRMPLSDLSHRSQLALALNNLSERLGDVGCDSEAFSTLEEAVSVYRELTEESPDQAAWGLAMTCWNRARRLLDVGRQDEATDALTERVSNLRWLSRSNPAQLPEFAKALRDLAGLLLARESYHDALPVVEESLVAHQELFAQFPLNSVPAVTVAAAQYALVNMSLRRYSEAVPIAMDALWGAYTCQLGDVYAEVVAALQEEFLHHAEAIAGAWALSGKGVPTWWREHTSGELWTRLTGSVDRHRNALEWFQEMLSRLYNSSSWQYEAEAIGRRIREDPSVAPTLAAALTQAAPLSSSCVGALFDVMVGAAGFVTTEASADALLGLGTLGRLTSPPSPTLMADQWPALASRIAGTQHPSDVQVLLLDISRFGPEAMELGLLICHELAIRGTDVGEEAGPFQEWAVAARHKLARIPLRLVQLEAQLHEALPQYGPSSFGASLFFPSRYRAEWPLGPREFLPEKLTRIWSVDAESRVCAAVSAWADGSNGKHQAELFIVGEDVFDESDSSLLGVDVHARAIDPGDALLALFSAASLGGAHPSGLFGANGRHAMWQSISGLLNCDGQVDELSTRANSARWYSLVSTSSWFYGSVWDVFLVAVTDSVVGVLAATDRP